jgi:protein-tyrosine phosphatase
MIDIHTHIIYGIDDGARTLKEAQEMIRLAVADGSTHMVATSHYARDVFHYTSVEYHSRLEELNIWCKNEDIEMTIYSGNEFYLNFEDLKGLKDKKCLTINNSNYLLVEVSNLFKISKIEEMLEIVEHMGYKIIIAHIERLKWVLDDFKMIEEWYSRGYLFQINATSILRKDYKENYKSAHKLIKHGYVHMIASDGHRENRRQPLLKDAYEYIANILGNEAAELLFVSNPFDMTYDKEIKGLREHKLHNNFTIMKLFKSSKGVK